MQSQLQGESSWQVSQHRGLLAGRLLMASAAVDPWPPAGTCWWVSRAPRSGAATGQQQAHVGSGGHPEWQGAQLAAGGEDSLP